MKKRKIIGLLMLLLPVLAFAQASGGQVKKPVKTAQQSASAKPAKKAQAKKPAQPAKASPAKVPTKAMPKLSMAIRQFFPIWGITLNGTTWSQAEALGYEVKSVHNGGKYVEVNKGAKFCDFEEVGYFNYIYLYPDSDFPSEWKKKGFSWDNSYDKWIQVFKNLGFSIEVVMEPTLMMENGRQTLTALFIATSSDKTLEFSMDFNYGIDGNLTSSPKTLGSIIIWPKDPKEK